MHFDTGGLKDTCKSFCIVFLCVVVVQHTVYSHVSTCKE